MDVSTFLEAPNARIGYLGFSQGAASRLPRATVGHHRGRKPFLAPAPDTARGIMFLRPEAATRCSFILSSILKQRVAPVQKISHSCPRFSSGPRPPAAQEFEFLLPLILNRVDHSRRMAPSLEDKEELSTPGQPQPVVNAYTPICVSGCSSGS